MKILLIGDPHFKKDNLNVMKDICKEILEIIDNKIPDLVISLGDTLDTHERLYLAALTDATNFYIDIAKRCQLVVLIGNHDRVNNSDFLSPVHPFVGLKEIKNITVVDTTIWDQNRNFIYVPYIAPGRFNEALAKVDYFPYKDGRINNNDRSPLLIFCHQEFMGCIMGVQTSSEGDVWSTHLPQIFSGHIHQYQVLPSICYVGTFMQQNYGESPDKALMMLYPNDEDGKIIIDQETNRPKILIERIKLKSTPLKVTIHMNLTELQDFSSMIPSDCLVKVVLHIDATDVPSLKTNLHYSNMKKSVDKVVEKIESNCSSLAESIIRDFKEKGILVPNKKVFNYQEIVTAMLQNDPFTLNIFETEILK